MGKAKGKDRKVKRVELKDPEMREFLNRVEGRVLVDEDYELIKGMAETLRCLSQSVDDSAASIKRLMRYLFGAPTETAKKLFPKEGSDKAEAAPENDEPSSFQTIIANCLSHARRNFVDVVDTFPEECRHVIECLGKVYHHDDLARKRKLDPDERL